MNWLTAGMLLGNQNHDASEEMKTRIKEQKKAEKYRKRAVNRRKNVAKTSTTSTKHLVNSTKMRQRDSTRRKQKTKSCRCGKSSRAGTCDTGKDATFEDSFLLKYGGRLLGGMNTPFSRNPQDGIIIT